MTNMTLNDDDLRCPCKVKSKLLRNSAGYICTSASCVHSSKNESFKKIGDIPVLVSDRVTDTVFSGCGGDVLVERPFVKTRPLKKFFHGSSVVTKENCERFVKGLTNESERSKVLIIGGAEPGASTDRLWSDEGLVITSGDIYASNTTNVLFDAHYLPFNEKVFDGVWIQAVLEHVVDPNAVVAEIERVLKPNGLVYAETPFMQQVHEGAYDFTRFTVLGHRYLFKRFEQIDIGGVGGPEVALAWSIRYFFLALTRNKLFARLLGAGARFLLRPFSKLMSRSSMFDASSGVYFLGRKPKKQSQPLTHKELISLYRGEM